jgi:hypothetical protein
MNDDDPSAYNIFCKEKEDTTAYKTDCEDTESHCNKETEGILYLVCFIKISEIEHKNIENQDHRPGA